MLVSWKTPQAGWEVNQARHPISQLPGIQPPGLELQRQAVLWHLHGQTPPDTWPPLKYSSRWMHILVLIMYTSTRKIILRYQQALTLRQPLITHPCLLDALSNTASIGLQVAKVPSFASHPPSFLSFVFALFVLCLLDSSGYHCTGLGLHDHSQACINFFLLCQAFSWRPHLSFSNSLLVFLKVCCYALGPGVTLKIHWFFFFFLKKQKKCARQRVTQILLTIPSGTENAGGELLSILSLRSGWSLVVFDYVSGPANHNSNDILIQYFKWVR